MYGLATAVANLANLSVAESTPIESHPWSRTDGRTLARLSALSQFFDKFLQEEREREREREQGKEGEEGNVITT